MIFCENYLRFISGRLCSAISQSILLNVSIFKQNVNIQYIIYRRVLMMKFSIKSILGEAAYIDNLVSIFLVDLKRVLKNRKKTLRKTSVAKLQNLYRPRRGCHANHVTNRFLLRFPLSHIIFEIRPILPKKLETEKLREKVFPR